MTENMPRWPGWETKQAIGHGSYGAVYELERVVFGETERAALKVMSIPQDRSEIAQLRSEGETDESVTRIFRSRMEELAAEYRYMKRLENCPYVVRVDDVECVQHADGFGWDIYIKMELLTPLLRRLGEELTTTAETVTRLGTHMCRALAECAKFDILHRDIKPQNIFVADNGDYKLGDFGIARVRDPDAEATARIGTFGYMAPEVYNGRPYGASADLYSLGLVLYWLLNERRGPFVEDNTPQERERALRRRMGGEALPEPKHGGEALRAIVRRACAFDPAERYQTAAEMLADLEALESDASGEESWGAPAPSRRTAPKPSTAALREPHGEKAAKKKSSRAGLVLALLLAAAGLGLFALRALRPQPAPADVSPAPTAGAETAAPTEAPTSEPTPTPTPAPDIRYEISNGELTIRGSGRMPDYGPDDAPWASHRDTVTAVVVDEGVTGIGEYAFSSFDLLTSVKLPESLESIGEHAFVCSRLRTIEIPAGVTQIAGSAFFGCPGLSAVTVSPESASFDSVGGVLFNKEHTALLLFPNGFNSSQQRFIIPDGVTEIGECAFGSMFLDGVCIPESVTRIRKNAFGNQASIKTIEFTGTREQWDAIEVEEGNLALTAAEMRFLSE